MNRIHRYATALLMGTVVTGGVTLLSEPGDRSPVLLVGIAQVYIVGTAIGLRYRDVLRSTDGPNWASAAFTGVTTFGCFSLLYGVTPTLNFSVAVLGFGLASMGFVAGIAFDRGITD